MNTQPDTQADRPPTIDTGLVINHRGRKFQVRRAEPVDDKLDSPWILVPVSGRGPSYTLLRNAPRPYMLFGVAWSGSKVLPGWFSDKDGTLKSLG